MDTQLIYDRINKLNNAFVFDGSKIVKSYNENMLSTIVNRKCVIPFINVSWVYFEERKDNVTIVSNSGDESSVSLNTEGILDQLDTYFKWVSR